MDDMRLIDANALLREFEKRQEQQINEYCDCFLNDAQELSTEWWCVEDLVASAPTIDAVEVVRCRNCRLWRRTEKHYGKCPFLIGENQYTSEDGFCNLGEKMDATDNNVGHKDGGAD